MGEEWFRKTSWTSEESEDFFTRLKRSRQFSRSQYLRIQASHLAHAGTRHLTLEAMTLLDLLFEEYPDQLEMASAYLQYAECLTSLGRIEEALGYFKKSIDFELAFPNVRTEAPIKFGLTAIQYDCDSEYAAVLRALENFEPSFPVDRFRMDGIRAIISRKNRDDEMAIFFATRALSAAEETDSGFRYHPKIGLVSDADTVLRKQLGELLGR
jgi:tetratricopeptide (TPR) repeat protein